MYDAMFFELRDRKDVTVLVDNPNTSFCKRILLKKKVQKLTQGRFDFLAYEKNNLYSTIREKMHVYNKVYVLFLNAGLYHNPYLAGILRKYKEEFNNLKYILFYLDIFGVSASRNADYLRNENIFDLVYTIDKNNASDNNLIVWNTIYSKTHNDFIANAADLYFCGVLKGRERILLKCLQKARENGVKCSFEILREENSEVIDSLVNNDEVTVLKDYKKYDEVLYGERSAKCILEVVQKGQTALTLRPYEAVVYNKKLLTNNKSILEFKYYNPRFMRVFNSVDDIDWEWVTNSEEIEYNYQGDFSPELLLDDIRKRLDIYKGEIC